MGRRSSDRPSGRSCGCRAGWSTKYIVPFDRTAPSSATYQPIRISLSPQPARRTPPRGACLVPLRMRATARRTRRSHRPPDRPGDPRLRRAALDAIHFAAVLDRSASTRSCLPVLAEPAPPVGSPVRPRGRGATASGTAHHFAVRAAPCPQTVAPGRRRHLPPSQPRYPVSPATQSPPHPHGTPTRNASSTLAPANRCPTGNQGQAAPVAPGIDRLLRQPPRFLCAAMLRRIDTLTTDIAALDVSIDELITPFADAVVRLDEIPGIGQRSAQELVAEIGVRMTAFPTAAHLVPWARLPPHRQTVSRPRQDRVHRQRQPHGSPMPSARSSPDWPARTPSSATATAAWPGDAARNGPSSRSATPSSRSSGTPCPTRTHAPIRVSHSAPRLQRVATCSTADRSKTSPRSATIWQQRPRPPLPGCSGGRSR